MIKSIITFIVPIFLQFGFLFSSDRSGPYPYKTQNNKEIYICFGDMKTPAFIKIDDKSVFQTEKQSNGAYATLDFAGSPYSDTPVQVIRLTDKKPICLRFVIEVSGDEKNHYIIDLSSDNPHVVGPFLFLKPEEYSDEVKSVFWGKTYALIKFKTLRRFKYYYKERTVIRD